MHIRIYMVETGNKLNVIIFISQKLLFGSVLIDSGIGAAKQN